MDRKYFIKIVIGSLLTTGLAYSSGLFKEDTKEYYKMSTYELQVEVEKLSKQGKLPFEMGLELIHRWSNYQI